MRKREFHGHGGGKGKKRSPIYTIWAAMKQRCHNPSHKDYRCYGGRKIYVCKEWQNSFQAFCDFMGPRPIGATLERVDGARGYEPGNVVWADRKQQANNRRTTVWVVVNGEQMNRSDACKSLGVNYDRVRARMRAGIPFERAATLPLRASWKEAKI